MSKWLVPMGQHLHSNGHNVLCELLPALFESLRLHHSSSGTSLMHESPGEMPTSSCSWHSYPKSTPFSELHFSMQSPPGLGWLFHINASLKVIPKHWFIDG